MKNNRDVIDVFLDEKENLIYVEEENTVYKIDVVNAIEKLNK